MATGDAKSKTMILGQSLIPAINKLQDVLSQLGSDSAIDLPQVAVIGTQGSGKSSVLGALAGRDLFPRGSNICTRRPLVLQFVHIPLPEGNELYYEEWGEFSHLPGQRFTDFSAIRKEIQIETEREAGANKGISDKQIKLNFFSPYVLNIKLVDLPGITRVRVGDQPLDIESQIKQMIMSYIDHPSCVILAVSPANSDLANSDALHVARVSDTDGSRMIGVITKLDVVDGETDACNVILGNVPPLRLGYIGVVNQSEQDIGANQSIRDAIAYEKNFFDDHPVFHRLTDQCGISQLAKKLNQILAKNVKFMLPDLRAKIHGQMVIVKQELASYVEVTKSDVDQGRFVLSILKEFSDAFTSTIEGKHEEMTFELVGGARIHEIIQSVFVKRLEDMDPCEDISDKDIEISLQNAMGCRGALFVPEVPFQVLLRRKIGQLLDPSLQCVHIIYGELVKLANRCRSRDLLQLPVLQRRLEEVVGTCLHEGLISALTMVKHIIEMEMDYINTSHHSFIGGSKAVAAARQQHQPPVVSDPTPKMKENADFNQLLATDKVQKLPVILARASPSRFITNNVRWHNKFRANGCTFPGNRGISSIFEPQEPIASGDDGEAIPSANVEAIPSSNGGEGIPSVNDWDTILSVNSQDSNPSTNNELAIPLACGREEIQSAIDNSNIFSNCNHAPNFEPFDNVEHVHVSSVIQLREENADFNQLLATDKVQKLPAMLARASPSRFITNNVRWHNKFRANGCTFPGNWGISSIFELEEPIASGDDREAIASTNVEAIPSSNGGEGIPSVYDWDTILSVNSQNSNPSTNDELEIPLACGREEIPSAIDNSNIFSNYNHAPNFEPFDNVESVHESSIIQLREPPAVLKSTEAHTENLAMGIVVTKIILRSYYNIVTKNIQDRVPKAIMHFLVNNVKRQLLSILIKELYREELFTEMLQERDDIAVKREQCKNILQVLQQAVCTLDDLSLD